MARIFAFSRLVIFPILNCTLITLILFAFIILPEGTLAQVRDVPRNRTLIMSLFGPGPTELTEDTGLANSNPYSLGALSRIKTILNKTIYEFLYLYNHNSGEEIPWLAESYRYNSDFTEITIILRRDIKWNDGEPFRAQDIAFTLDLLKDNTSLVFASDIKEWVKEVQVVNQRTARIILNKPNPRFFFIYFIENSIIQLPILPEHIWRDKSPENFTNVDIEKGWPVGTGPYKLVSSTSSSQLYDRREDWWAAETGFQSLPMPLRIMVLPPGREDNVAQQLVENELDIGPVLLKSTFEAAKRLNPKLVSWNRQGPQWGAADACLLSVGMNTKVDPFFDRDVRRAIAYALDREKIIELVGGGGAPQVLPLSSYGVLDPYRRIVQDLIAKYNPGEYNLAKSEELMTKKGYSKDRDGFWINRFGKKVSFNLDVPSWLRLLGPVVAQQLHDAGFEVNYRLYPTDLGPFFKSVQTGKSKIWIITHCRSSREPHDTLQHFHSRFSAQIGERTRHIWANSRYENHQYDRIIDQMETLVPSATDLQYIRLIQQALEIYLRDLPQIYISDEIHIVTFNENYWKGWARSDEPYVAPYSIWAGFLLEILRLRPTQ